jgi:predicted metallopeptidase
MSRFVRPEQTTLTIEQVDTLTVRTRLSYGERSDQYARMYSAGLDGKVIRNAFAGGLALVGAYLIDWSLKDDDGVPVAIKHEPIDVIESVLRSLDPESFAEIVKAIEDHEAAQLEKKVTTGATASAAT